MDRSSLFLPGDAQGGIARPEAAGLAVGVERASEELRSARMRTVEL